MRSLAETPREALGLAVAEWRKLQRWSQADFARASGAAQSSVSRWEKGQVEPSLLGLWRAGCNVSTILRRAEEIAERSGVTLSDHRKRRVGE